MKPAYATLEPNFHNQDGSTLVLYYHEVPDEAQVKQACDELLGKLPLGVDTSDPTFSFEEHPTPVSEASKLHRFEVYPTG